MRKPSADTVRRPAAIKDEAIDFSDIPELGDDFWSRARVVTPSVPAGEDGADTPADPSTSAQPTPRA